MSIVPGPSRPLPASPSRPWEEGGLSATSPRPNGSERPTQNEIRSSPVILSGSTMPNVQGFPATSPRRAMNTVGVPNTQSSEGNTAESSTGGRSGGRGDVEMMEEDGDTVEDGAEDENGPGDSDDEGEGDEDEDEEDEDEEEEEEEDDDDEEGDDKSEDLEGGDGDDDIEITSTRPAQGDQVGGAAKTEPGTEGDVTQGEAADGEAPKPKKKARRRARSEDDMPAPPPPMKTIRLERPLIVNSEDPLEWNILDDARAHGMVAEWDEQNNEEPDDGLSAQRTVPATSAGPSVPEDGPTGLTNGPETAGPSGPSLLSIVDGDAEEIAQRFEQRYAKSKPKRKVIETYDLEDDFIDDAELEIDAPTHLARPAKEGFFVHQGALELLYEEVKPARSSRPKPNRNPKAPAPVHNPRPSLSSLLAARNAGPALHGHGTRLSPIAIDSDNEGAGPSKPHIRTSPPPPLDDTPVPIDRALFKAASREPDLIPPFAAFPEGLRRSLMVLHNRARNHHWGHDKAKFPEVLKEPLRLVCREAWRVDMYGAREGGSKLCLALPGALPYNQYTLTKLAWRMSYEPYWKWLEDCEDLGVEEMAKLVEPNIDAERERHEGAMTKFLQELADWETRHPKANGTPSSSVDPNGDVPMNDEDGEGDPLPRADDRPRPPRAKFALTPEMADLFQQLIENSMEMTNFNHRAWKEFNISSNTQDFDHSEKGLRQILYKKLVGAFPEGYMTTGDLSKEMSRKRARTKGAQAQT